MNLLATFLLGYICGTVADVLTRPAVTDAEIAEFFEQEAGR